VAASHHALATRTAIMSEPCLITLLTDFGLEDPYVGVMKGVLLRECPTARIVDLTHALSPYDKVSAAFWIDRAFSWFPRRTVHVVVVDPGVGSARRGLVVAAHGQFFVGPDNGILTRIFACDRAAEARVIEPKALGGTVPSRTFHGRDVFAPVAARLMRGALTFAEVGSQITTLCDTVLPAPACEGDTWFGQVATVDRFGNALTNLLEPTSPDRYEVRVVGRSLPVRSTYADAGIAEIFGLFGSFGTLEVAMREGNAAAALGLAPGVPVELRRVQ
jgi:S-adenosylmethionine hydrolase